MSARGKNAPPCAQTSESAIYLGRDVAGTVVVVRKGSAIALDAAGRRIGIFKTATEAMRAILDKAREGGK